MFCPECGQQQVSQEVRFCSRCGFQLAAVSGLLATRGATNPEGLPVVLTPESPRRKGVRQGGKLLLIGIFLIPFLGLLSEMVEPGLPEEIMIIGVLVCLLGFLRLIYAALFEDGPYRRQAAPQPAYVPPAAHAGAELPPARGVPARDYVAPRADTSEIAYRPSVTEQTTRLLDDQQDTSAR